MVIFKDKLNRTL